MKPVLRLALQSCGKNFAHKRIVVPVEDHGTVVVLKMSIRIFVSFVRSEMRHSEPARWICPLDLIREWTTCLCWSCLVEAHRQQPRSVGNYAIVRSGASQLLLEFASAGAVELWLPPVVTYGSGPLFPMLDLSTSWLRCMWHVPSRRTSCSQAAG